jgi:ABC-type uncharacterized transport system permease subunit
VQGWSNVLNLSLLAATLKIATPLIFAALAAVMSERGGVVNIGIEGTMLLSAFAAVAGSQFWGPWVGLVLAMVVGGVLGLLHAYLSVTVKVNQIVAATAVNIAALGIPRLIIPYIWPGHFGETGLVPPLPEVRLPFIADLPVVGPVLGEHSLLTYVALILVLVLNVLLFRTRFGLRLRAVGEHPRAADTVGIDVSRMRYAGVIIGGVLAGLGGAFLTIGKVPQFAPNVANGRGFMGLAATVFGNWRPGGALVACLIFGFADAFQAAAQPARVLPVPRELLLSLPYILTLVAVAGFVGKSVAPAASGKPYEKG